MPKIIKDSHDIEWQRTRLYTERRLITLREEVEAPGLGPIETELLRGQILFANEILSLDKEDDHAIVPDVDYLPKS